MALDALAVIADAFGNLMRDHPRLTPRNKFIYGWMVPLTEQLRMHVAQATGQDQADASIADLLEWIYLELGWSAQQTVRRFGSADKDRFRYSGIWEYIPWRTCSSKD